MSLVKGLLTFNLDCAQVLIRRHIPRPPALERILVNLLILNLLKWRTLCACTEIHCAAVDLKKASTDCAFPPYIYPFLIGIR